MKQKNEKYNHTFWEIFLDKFFSFKLSRFLMYLFLCFWSITTILPFLWVINNSFKDSDRIISNTFEPAINGTLENYQKAFETINIFQSYLNSLIMSGGTMLLTLLLAGLASFVLARINFKLRGAIQAILIMTLLIPGFATIVPNFELFNKLDLLNTYWALILPSTAGHMAFTILVISGFMTTIPKEIEEAAVMDGCNRFKMYYKIFFPMSRPAFATAGIFIFLWTYNDLFSSLIFVARENVRPIVVLLADVSSLYGTDYGLMSATVALATIPVIIVYLFIAKFIEQGLGSAGSVKG